MTFFRQHLKVELGTARPQKFFTDDSGLLIGTAISVIRSEAFPDSKFPDRNLERDHLVFRTVQLSTSIPKLVLLLEG